MNPNVTNTLIGEIHSASTYLERVLHTLMDITPYGNTKEVKEHIATTYFDIMTLMESGPINEKFVGATHNNYTSRELRQKIQSSATFCEAMLKLDFKRESLSEFIVQYINIIYENAFKLHQISFNKNGIEIQYPRLSALEYDEVELLNSDTLLLKFRLPFSKIKELGQSDVEVHSLDIEREKKYNSLLQRGHEAIYNKENIKALDFFQKAQNIKNTAEVLTLIGWCFSLNKDYEKAKTYCLKAIQKDPDYGPPYNDLGNYLLTEGQVNESLKWFNLAKKATYFQNKEYPYINSGRAYIIKKDYEKALEEFSTALTIVPYHEELHETVNRLRKGLEKGPDIFDTLTD